MVRVLKASIYYCLGLMICQCSQTQSSEDIDWVFVEGGGFTMGMDEPIISPGRDTIFGYTLPARAVTVDDFYLSRYEITVKQFRAYCADQGLAMPEPPAIDAYGRPTTYQWRDEHPMLATWEESLAFAGWAGGRLPTEAEWEYAAKGGNQSRGYAYSGSDTATVVGWVRENADSTFHRVGLLRPNELGLYDMTGNLNEWVSDWWQEDFDVFQTPSHNPTGPDTGTDKVSKGPGWYYGTADDQTGTPLQYALARSEIQYASPVDERSYGFGFRIAKDAR